MKIEKLLLTFFVLVWLSPPVSASVYCACCAEPGQYTLSVSKPNATDFALLDEIKYSTAELFTTAAYPEDIKGITPLAENYSITNLFQNKTWKFTFKDEKGKTGTLTLPMPTSMVYFAVDLRDREIDPWLYKELRFKYKVRQGTGIFQAGISPLTEYFLVLQGKGNNCTNASDFKNWRLEITGKKASYAFYGKLKTTE